MRLATGPRRKPWRKPRGKPRGRRADDIQVVVGLLGLAVTGASVHESTVGPVEATVFWAVNRLPDGMYAPSWLVMQSGNALSAPVTALLVWRSGRRRLAARVLTSGLLAWWLAKLVKRAFRRPRPTSFVGDTTVRGQPPSGLGYVSGHAAVATAIALALRSERPDSGRAALAFSVPVVALSRMYVGAHLPLDVVGGVALGTAVDGCVGRLLARCTGTGQRPEPDGPLVTGGRPAPSR